MPPRKPLPVQMATFLQRIEDGTMRIPPYPAAASQLAERIASDDYRLIDLARVVGTDQVLTAAVLRAASAAAMSGARTTTSLPAAIQKLGATGLVRMAFAVGVGLETTKCGPLRPLRRIVWRQALIGAELSRLLATRFGVNADDAYVCGMLHDIGKVIGLACLEEHMADGAPTTSPGECFGLVEQHHTRLGLVLATMWKLSPVVCDAVRSHHSRAENESAMVKLLRATDRIAELLELAPFLMREMLDGVPGLDERSKDRVFEALPQLIAVIASLDAASPPPPRTNVLTGVRVPRLSTTLPGRHYPFACKLTCADQGGPAGAYQGKYIARSGIAFIGRAQMHEQSLVKLRVETDDDLFDMWCTVTMCNSTPAGYAVEARPLASGAVRTKWRKLVCDAILASDATHSMKTAAVVATKAEEVEAEPEPAPRYGSFDVDAGWSLD